MGIRGAKQSCAPCSSRGNGKGENTRQVGDRVSDDALMSARGIGSTCGCWSGRGFLAGAGGEAGRLRRRMSGHKSERAPNRRVHAQHRTCQVGRVWESLFRFLRNPRSRDAVIGRRAVEIGRPGPAQAEPPSTWGCSSATAPNSPFFFLLQSIIFWGFQCWSMLPFFLCSKQENGRTARLCPIYLTHDCANFIFKKIIIF